LLGEFGILGVDRFLRCGQDSIGGDRAA
jgi:hypothetical protein